MKRCIPVVLALFFACVVAGAKAFAFTDDAKRLEYIEKQYTFFFRAGKSDIDRDYKGNGRTIETMVADLNKTFEMEGTVPDSLTVFASSSPEGSVALNERLSRQRAVNTRDLLVRLLPQFKAENIKVENRANDWSGVVLAARRDSTFSFRDIIVRIFARATSGDVEYEFRNKYPHAYASVRDRMFDNMRTASVKIRVIRTETNVDEFTVDHTLTITSENPMDFTSDGGSGNVTYSKTSQDESAPVVRCESDWIQEVVPGPALTSFKVAPNDQKAPRSAEIVLEEYGKTYNVKVNQAGRDPQLTLLSSDQMHIPAEGGAAVISFEKNINDDVLPVVVSSSDHVTVAAVEESAATLSVAPNTASEAKTSTVELDYYGKKYQVQMVQDAAPQPQEKQRKPFYMSAKTNMLYDLAIVPNIGVEFYLGKNFSVAGNWMYSWWKSDPKAWYWRVYGGDLALRYWFGKAAKAKPLTGHHAGIYGQMITYDFELGKKGFIAEPWSWSVGAEYGYSLPIAHRLNIDFTIGVGYHWGIFEEYLPIDGHYVWQATKKRQYIGPTKAEISLVWLLGYGNYNANKNKKKNR